MALVVDNLDTETVRRVEASSNPYFHSSIPFTNLANAYALANLSRGYSCISSSEKEKFWSAGYATPSSVQGVGPFRSSEIAVSFALICPTTSGKSYAAEKFGLSVCDIDVLLRSDPAFKETMDKNFRELDFEDWIIFFNTIAIPKAGELFKALNPQPRYLMLHSVSHAQTIGLPVAAACVPREDVREEHVRQRIAAGDTRDLDARSLRNYSEVYQEAVKEGIDIYRLTPYDYLKTKIIPIFNDHSHGDFVLPAGTAIRINRMIGTVEARDTVLTSFEEYQNFLQADELDYRLDTYFIAQGVSSLWRLFGYHVSQIRMQILNELGFFTFFSDPSGHVLYTLLWPSMTDNPQTTLPVLFKKRSVYEDYTNSFFPEGPDVARIGASTGVVRGYPTMQDYTKDLSPNKSHIRLIEVPFDVYSELSPEQRLGIRYYKKGPSKTMRLHSVYDAVLALIAAFIMMNDPQLKYDEMCSLLRLDRLQARETFRLKLAMLVSIVRTEVSAKAAKAIRFTIDSFMNGKGRVDVQKVSKDIKEHLIFHNV